MYICRVVQVCSILDLLGVTGTRSLDAVQLGFKQLNNCTAVQIYSCTIVQFYNCTVVQLYSCTIVQLGVAVNGSPSTVQLIFEQLNDYKVVRSPYRVTAKIYIVAIHKCVLQLFFLFCYTFVWMYGCAVHLQLRP